MDDQVLIDGEGDDGAAVAPIVYTAPIIATRGRARITY